MLHFSFRIAVSSLVGYEVMSETPLDPLLPLVAVEAENLPLVVAADISPHIARDKVVCVAGLMSKQACADVVSLAGSLRKGAPPSQRREESSRKNARVDLHSPSLAAHLFERLLPLLPKEGFCTTDYELSSGMPYTCPLPSCDYGSDLETSGPGRPVGVAPNLRVERYLPGEGFRVHRDANRIVKKDGESVDITLYSVVLYLRDGAEFKGGCTRFVTDREGSGAVIVQPRVGSAILFRQELLHEGDVVIEGEKLILRADVVYRFRAVDT